MARRRPAPSASTLTVVTHSTSDHQCRRAHSHSSRIRPHQRYKRASIIAGVRVGPGVRAMVNSSETTRVLVVGGGFAGVGTARRLASEPGVRGDVAGSGRIPPVPAAALPGGHGGADADGRAIRPERDLLGTRQCGGRRGRGRQRPIRSVARSPSGSGEEIAGDVLVLAAGTKPNFFGVPGAQENAYPLYSVEDASRALHRLLRLFEDAAAKPELLDAGALTFVVVGGGPTGVETAGALARARP